MEFTKFDHSKDQLFEALYVDKIEIDDFNAKCKQFAKDRIKSKDKKVSILIEQILPEFSYNELVLISAKYFKNIINEYNKEDIPNEIAELLRKKFGK